MFQDVPGCSGMFRVRGFIDGQKKKTKEKGEYVTVPKQFKTN